MLPKPFARVIFRFGPMIDFHSEGPENSFEGQRCHLESVMKQALIF